MVSLPIHNPAVPFLGFIPGGIHVGSRILIRGFMPHMSDRFTIDLQCGTRNMQDDIALHLSVRPAECSIVRNHYQNYAWGPEERIGGCPINRGHPYDIEIYAENGRFSIRVNGNHFCEFRHRLPLPCISHVSVGGSTTLSYVGKDHCSPHAPPLKPPKHPVAPILGAVIGGIVGAAAAAAAHKPNHHCPPPHHGPPPPHRPPFGPPHHGPPHHGPHHHGPPHGPHKPPPGAHFR